MTGKLPINVNHLLRQRTIEGERVEYKAGWNPQHALHTILRLPTGVFYAQGVKANVIFFDNREASPQPWTKQVWYYDYRTNSHHTLKKKPLRFEDLSDFIACYNPHNRQQRTATWDEHEAPEGRWRSYSYEDLTARDKASLAVFWLQGQESDRPGQPA